MYDVALSVLACLRAGTDVHVAWLASADRRDGTQAVAITPGGGRIGSLLDGALDDAIVQALPAIGDTGGVVDIMLGPLEAIITGLTEGTELTVAIVPGDVVPQPVWEALAAREQVSFAFPLDGQRFTGCDQPENIESMETDTTVVVCRYQPVPHVVIVGGGPIVDALRHGFDLVGWQTSMSDPASAEGAAANLSVIDSVVVMGHDVEASGRALQAAVGSKAGYIASVGSESMQHLRQEWLAYRGVDWDARIHGPAGLPIGATTPGEIAVSIVAEAVAASRLHDL